MSLLTGLYPDTHGVVDEDTALGPGLPTLAESLRAAGYRTEAVVTSRWLDASFGFDRGFDGYRRLEEGLTSAARVTDAALALLDRTDGRVDGAPLFLFLHHFEAHSDFRAEENRWPYWSPPAARPPEAVVGTDASWCTGRGVCATGYLDALTRRGQRLDGPRLEALRALYDAGVRTLDGELGRLFDALRERGLWERTVVAVTADHGEELQEHGQLLHAQPYDETVAVPLILKAAGAVPPRARIEQPVRLIDVAPTLLDLAGVEPPDGLQGRSLLPLVEGGDGTAVSALSQDKLRPSRYALRRGPWKLIVDLDGGAAELYDHRTDPGELDDRAAAQPHLVAELSRELTTILTASRERAAALAPLPPPPLSPTDRARLRALGYLD
jgi:arylsulfatase A-like enzyme